MTLSSSTCLLSPSTTNNILRNIGVGVGAMLATTALFVNSNGNIIPKPDFNSPSFIIDSDCSSINMHNLNYNGITISFIGDTIMENKKMQNIEKLNTFKSLGENWNGYKASPISHGLISSVIDLLSKLQFQPEVFPLASGKIQIEFDNDNGQYLEFELGEHCAASVYQVEANNDELEYEIDFDSQEICRIVNEFYE